MNNIYISNGTPDFVFQIKDKAKFKGTLQEYIASIKSNDSNYVDDPVSISNNILNLLLLLLLKKHTKAYQEQCACPFLVQHIM